jgi:hypothetical protein
MTVTKIALMLMQFRTRYPQGSLISELVVIDHGKYIVKTSVTVDGVILGTGLAAADCLETAEDRARDRALATLALDVNEPIQITKPAVISNGSIEPGISDQVVEPQSIRESVDLKETKNNSLVSPIQERSPVPPFLSKTVATNLEQLPHEHEEKETQKEEKVTSKKTNTDNYLESPSPVPGNKPQNLPSEMPSNSDLEQQETFSSNIFEQPSLAEPTETFSEWEINPPKDEPPKPSISVTPSETTETIEIDFNEIKNKTDVEIKRLGWTKEQGRDFLLKTYGKRSRLHLTDEELLDFLHYLESQPTA